MSKKALLICFALVCCQHENVDPWQNFKPFAASYDTYGLEKSDSYTSTGKEMGPIDFTNELSGLAESKVNENALWGNADSGNPDLLYLIDEVTGQLKASYRIAGLINDDWEDIAVGPGPIQGQSYIYLADIGDNNAERMQHIIYRFPEPLFSTLHQGKVIDLNIKVEKIIFNYPDSPHNAETLLLDPIHKDLYVVTKYGINSLLFVAKYPQSTEAVFTIEKVGAFPFREATAGDISDDGTKVLLKTYDQIFFWEKVGNDPLWHLLSSEPKLVSYNPIEIKGEAITWTKDGGYMTGSEKSGDVVPKLYGYGRSNNDKKRQP